MSGAGTNKTAANGTASKHAHAHTCAPYLISAGSGVMGLPLANYYCEKREPRQLINYGTLQRPSDTTLFAADITTRTQQLSVFLCYG